MTYFRRKKTDSSPYALCDNRNEKVPQTQGQNGTHTQKIQMDIGLSEWTHALWQNHFQIISFWCSDSF